MAKPTFPLNTNPIYAFHSNDAELIQFLEDEVFKGDEVNDLDVKYNDEWFKTNMHIQFCYFYGTEFKLTSARSSNTGKLQIIVDDGETITINKVHTSKATQNNKAILLYSSCQLETKFHKIQTICSDTEISIGNLLCITEMPPVTPPDQEVLRNPVGLINATCDELDYIGWWDVYAISGKANHGSYVTTGGKSARYIFRGKKSSFISMQRNRIRNTND